MGIEVERKFLLTNDGWRTGVERSVPMKQAYLGGDWVTIRARIEGARANLNIKKLRIGASRDEFEYPIPVEDALSLMELAGGGCTEKTRHYVRHAGMLWEIDEFHGDNEGLVVAEIELEHEGQEFEHPPWLGEEVTFDERYYNLMLARNPFKDWNAE